MGAIKVIRSDGGKPYICLEDLIGELETVKRNIEEEGDDEINRTDFLNVVLRTLHSMEEEYYTKVLIKKKPDDEK